MCITYTDQKVWKAVTIRDESEETMGHQNRKGRILVTCTVIKKMKKQEFIRTSLSMIPTFTDYGEIPVNIKSKFLHKNHHLLDTAHLF